MKKIIAFVFAFSLVLFWSDSVHAKQGRGQGRGPAVSGSQNRGPAVDRGRSERREDAIERREKKTERRVERRQDRFEDRLERNPELRDKLARLLPAGSNVRNAASGFKNQGQFIAAVHASKNLNIPFDQLKARMTGSNPMPLGQAIHDLKPDMMERDWRREAERAERQARETEKSKG